MDGGHTCEYNMTYRDVASLCCTPEPNVTLGVNSIQIKNKVLKSLK